MKLSPREARSLFDKPDPKMAGFLIYGADPMRIALRRQELIKGYAGPNAEEDMRLTRMTGAEARKDPTAVLDALKAQGFFPGPRVVFVEEVTEAQAGPILSALEDWQEGDAALIVTAGTLNARSSLRKVFEAHARAYATGIYDDPPDQGEVKSILDKAGLSDIPRDAMSDIMVLARSLDPGDFAQTIEKLSLYKRSESSPVTVEDIAAVAPLSTEAALDDVLNMVAEAKSNDIGPILKRLAAQGVQPVALSIAATRHFRTLHTAASDPGGVQSGLSRMRPPVFGPRRDRMARQASAWGARQCEAALTLLLDTDLTLRSSQKAPTMAVIERALIRIAMMGAR